MATDGLSTLKQQIGAWGKANPAFRQATPDSIAQHLLREVTELLSDPTDAEEMADVFHLLVQLATWTGADLEAAVARKFAINQQRIWKMPDAAGVVEHDRQVSR